MENKDVGQVSVANLAPPEEDPITIHLIQKILHSHDPNAQLISYSAKLGTQPGDNYMSIIHSADILFINSTGHEEKLDVMIKTIPQNELRLKELNKIAVFTKEVSMYAEVLPEMIRFQKEKKIHDDEILANWPTCLASFCDGGANDFLAMENLRGKGYKMANRTTALNHPQVLLVLSTLAKFHAISFAQFGGDGAKILSTYPFLEEKMFPDPTKEKNSLKDYFQSVLRCEVKLLRDEGHVTEAEILALFCRDDTINDVLFNEISKISSDMKNAVTSHGDCWTNNIMFLYDDEDKLVDLKLLDFQISRYAPRSVDVSYFLYACIPQLDIRMEEEYLKWYDDHFIQFLGKLGVNRCEGDGLEFQDFIEEYENCMFYGVMLGLIMTPMMCMESQGLPSSEEGATNDFGDDAAAKVFQMLNPKGTIGQSISTKKICNLALNHLTRCPQVIRKMSEI